MLKNILSFTTGTMVGIGVTNLYPKEINHFVDNKTVEDMKEKLEKLIDRKK